MCQRFTKKAELLSITTQSTLTQLITGSTHSAGGTLDLVLIQCRQKKSLHLYGKKNFIRKILISFLLITPAKNIVSTNAYSYVIC